MLGIFFAISIVISIVNCEKVLFAINLGGETLNASDGIVYRSYSEGLVRSYPEHINDVPDQDQLLYRTGNFGPNGNIGVNLPIAGNGDYTLTLKFLAEPYLIAPMNVTIYTSSKHLVLQNFNATSEAGGFYKICDKVITFEVYNSKLIWEDEYSDVQYNKIWMSLESEINPHTISYRTVLSASVGLSAMSLKYRPAKRPEELMQELVKTQTLLLRSIRKLMEVQKNCQKCNN